MKVTAFIQKTAKKNNTETMVTQLDIEVQNLANNFFRKR